MVWGCNNLDSYFFLKDHTLEHASQNEKKFNVTLNFKNNNYITNTPTHESL
jgi:hypothetical protein